MYTNFSSYGATSIRKIDVPVFSQVSRRKVTLKYKPILAMMLMLLVLALFYHHSVFGSMENDHYSQRHNGRFFAGNDHILALKRKLTPYNHTYPLTKPVSSSTGSCFQIGIITDMDTESKSPDKSNTWISLLRYGHLSLNKQTLAVTINWQDDDHSGKYLTSAYSYGGRGMELSELIVFNGHAYSIDDHTGIVYEISDGHATSWLLLSDGDGHKAKGFKGEWMTTKNEKLYIGGLGKEWTTTDGIVLHNNPQWIKTVDKNGLIEHLNWIHVYKAMQRVSGYISPGYIIHESAVWSNIHNSWFFLPRRASHDSYDEILDEMRATNMLFQCSEDFSNVRVRYIGTLDHKARGFSSFKFVPGTNDYVIVALKTEEVKGKTRSYVTSFTLDGRILLPDQLISSKYKYEGIEFL